MSHSIRVLEKHPGPGTPKISTQGKHVFFTRLSTDRGLLAPINHHGEALRPHGDGISHASPPGIGNVASKFAETRDMPVTPTPARWRSGYMMQPVLNGSSMENASMDENKDQERWQPQGPSRTPSRASEARSGIRQRKILQKSLVGRPKHQTSLLDASKQAQVLVGALEAAQIQQQEMHQMIQEQIQAHLAEELSNWRAEQQVHEGIYMERITKLELEVSKLRTELTEAQCAIQQHKPVRQNTPAVDTQPNWANKQDNNHTPKVRERSQQPRQEPRFADLAALLSTRPGGQEWQEVM